MTIALQDLKSTFSLDTNPLQAGAKLAIAGVGALVAGIGIAAKVTMDWAADLDGLGDVMDGTNEQFAALAFVARKSGVGVEALTKAGTFLNKGLLKIDGSLDVTGKKLKEFGISVTDVNGNQKDSVALLEDIGKKYSELGTQTERVNLLTEIFGKSGAGLVDMFDTLAAEGGLDKVTKKVKAFGLAIDPARYERFNRNLEELKLIGTGLAVRLTEKVMPALEGFLDLVANPKKIDVGKILKWTDETVATFVNGLSTSINDWVSSGGPEQLSEKLISWIEGLGSSEAARSKSLEAAAQLVKTIGDAFVSIDWIGIFDALEVKGTEEMRNFWTTLEEQSKVTVRVLFQSSIPEGQMSIVEFWNGIEVAGTDGVRNAFNSMEVEGTNKVRDFFNNIEIQGTEGTRRFVESMVSGFMGTIDLFYTSINSFEARITDKLREIGKAFFSRASGWVQQAIAGFTGQVSSLISVVSNLVAEINAELKKIVTSFTISIKTVFSEIIGGSGTGKKGGKKGSSSGSGRDTGGAVIAGRAYNVGVPEMFVPNQSGRMEPIKDKPDKPMDLSDRSIRKIVDGLHEANLRTA